jgi:hypothetical protein
MVVRAKLGVFGHHAVLNRGKQPDIGEKPAHLRPKESVHKWISESKRLTSEARYIMSAAQLQPLQALVYFDEVY